MLRPGLAQSPMVMFLSSPQAAQEPPKQLKWPRQRDACRRTVEVRRVPLEAQRSGRLYVTSGRWTVAPGRRMLRVGTSSTELDNAANFESARPGTGTEARASPVSRRRRSLASWARAAGSSQRCPWPLPQGRRSPRRPPYAVPPAPISALPRRRLGDSCSRRSYPTSTNHEPRDYRWRDSRGGALTHSGSVAGHARVLPWPAWASAIRNGNEYSTRYLNIIAMPKQAKATPRRGRPPIRSA